MHHLGSLEVEGRIRHTIGGCVCVQWPRDHWAAEVLAACCRAELITGVCLVRTRSLIVFVGVAWTCRCRRCHDGRRGKELCCWDPQRKRWAVRAKPELTFWSNRKEAV